MTHEAISCPHGKLDPSKKLGMLKWQSHMHKISDAIFQAGLLRDLGLLVALWYLLRIADVVRMQSWRTSHFTHANASSAYSHQA